MPKITQLFALPIYEAEMDGYSAIQQSLIAHITSNFNSEFINE
jgi:hypothetical protein